MKSSAIFTLSPPSFLSSRPNAKTKTLPLGTCTQRASQPTHLHCAKMFVPGFGEASPEAKAANNLHNFFTYIAVKIVAAQLESYNPEAYQDLMEFLERHSLNDGDDFCATLMRKSFKHRSLVIVERMKYVIAEKFYLKETKAWMACLCKPCETLHLLWNSSTDSRGQSKTCFPKVSLFLKLTSNKQKVQVRSVYCKNDFDWEKLKREAAKRVDESNTMLMRDYVQETTHEK
ncbi:hypothetical protein Cgig2_011298 [Carnegiea gigantea]|uniref:Uncharacterized protein n=1 Tax=Carnegiea gigantea TaxID=171969 RepID=A0A9Q1JNH7_9CARY|nr:hypothetical protein Cgig2_011298 [Carnegiea gigantea]